MADNSLRHKTMLGMIWVGIQRFGTMFISFGSNIVLARLLSPDDFGCIGMLMIFIALSNTFIDGGFGSALIQKKRPTDEDYSTVFYWNIFLSVVLYVILYLCAPFVADFYAIPLLSYVLQAEGVILIINALAIVQLNQLRKQMEFKKLAIINVASATVSVIVAIIFAYYGFGVWTLVIQQIIQSSVVLILLWITCRWRPMLVFSVKSFKELFGFGAYILSSSLVYTFTNNFRSLVIGKVYSASQLGYFAQAQKLENVSSTSMATVIEQVSYPLLVEVKDDSEKFISVLRRFNTALLALVMPLMFTMVIVADPLIVFLFSERWLPSAPILQILSLQGIFLCIQGTSYNAIAAKGHSKTLFKWAVIKCFVGICLFLAGMYFWGFSGLLWGLLLGSVFVVVANYYLVGRFSDYSMSRQLLDVCPVALVATSPFLLALWISTLTNGNYFILTAIGVAYMAVYLAIVWFIPWGPVRELKSNVLAILQSIKNRH